jgi:hypothetical protein
MATLKQLNAALNIAKNANYLEDVKRSEERLVWK